MTKSSTTPRWVLPLTLVVSLVTVGLASFWPESKPKPPSPVIIKVPHWISQGLVFVAGGRFRMGTDDPPLPGQPNPHRIKPDEYPEHTVALDGFWMDATEVTNRQFIEFVAMTGYVTFSEKTPTREDFARSGADPSLFQDEHLVAGSLCYNPDFDRSTLDVNCDMWEYQVWKFVPGANWMRPEGPDSSIADRLDHPVVHVTWEDAVAYCDWAGKRLPTEAEYEYASRNAGQDGRYPWGHELTPGGEYLCNFFQGTFPTEMKTLDGFESTSPVKAYRPNSIGLYDISGNVWEWCHDYYDAQYYAVSPVSNPQGPEQSFDPQEPNIIKRVIRGGSFLCNTNSCTGYRSGARMKGEFTSGTFHTGFRGVVDSRGYALWTAREQAIEAWRKARNKSLGVD